MVNTKGYKHSKLQLSALLQFLSNEKYLPVIFLLYDRETVYKEPNTAKLLGEYDQHWDSNRFIFQHYDSTYTCVL